MIDSMAPIIILKRGSQQAFSCLNLGIAFGQSFLMPGKRSRELLADTVNAAIRSGKTTHAEMVEKEVVSNGRLGSLRNQSKAPTIDVLDAIAAWLKVEPWQLLHPDPHVRDFSREAISTALLVDALPASKRQAAYAMVVQMLEFGNTGPAATSREPTDALPQDQRTPRVAGQA